MADPVSWLMIEPGWRVESADGKDAGRVEEIDGYEDIFDGLHISFDALERRYVSADIVGEITTGTVHLTIPHDAVQKLPVHGPGDR
jgi:hypothetical protein